MTDLKEKFYQEIIIQYQLICEAFESNDKNLEYNKARYQAKIQAYVNALKWISEEESDG